MQSFKNALIIRILETNNNQNPMFYFKSLRIYGLYHINTLKCLSDIKLVLVWNDITIYAIICKVIFPSWALALKIRVVNVVVILMNGIYNLLYN